jgi:hypothetical protein
VRKENYNLFPPADELPNGFSLCEKTTTAVEERFFQFVFFYKRDENSFNL